MNHGTQAIRDFQVEGLTDDGLAHGAGLEWTPYVTLYVTLYVTP
ncbi:hypothetical protein [Achromobacter spanius]